MEQVAKDNNALDGVYNLDPRLLDSGRSFFIESGKAPNASLSDFRDMQANDDSTALLQTFSTPFTTLLQVSTATGVPVRPEISILISGTHEDRHPNIDPFDNLVRYTQMDRAKTTMKRPTSVPCSYETTPHPEQPPNATVLSTMTFPLRQGGAETPIDSDPTTGSPSLGSNSTALFCGWSGCNESFPDLMLLRHHVTETHVGRAKSALNLQCAWNGCGKKFKKRDNITSHLHIHIPYFEHVCDYCGRKWQRRHDLNKHLRGRHGPIIKDGRKHWPVKLFTDSSSDRRIAVTAIGSFPLAEPLLDLPKGHFHYITNEQPVPPQHQVSTTQGDLLDAYLKLASPTVEQANRTAGPQSSTYFALRYTRLSKDCTPQSLADEVPLSHGSNHSPVNPMASSTFETLDGQEIARRLKNSQANNPPANSTMKKYSLPTGHSAPLLHPSALSIHGKRKGSSNNTHLPLKRRHGSPAAAELRTSTSELCNDSPSYKLTKPLSSPLPYNLHVVRDADYVYAAGMCHDDSSTNQPSRNPTPVQTPPRFPQGCNTFSSPEVPRSNSPGKPGTGHSHTNSENLPTFERGSAKALALHPMGEHVARLANSTSRVGSGYYLL